MSRVRTRAWAHDAPWTRYIETLRPFLEQVASEVFGQPRDGRQPRWGHFVPTTIRLVDKADQDSTLIPDVDTQVRAAFVTGIKAVERARCYATARIQQIAARAYLAPLAQVPERCERGAWLATSGHPLKIPTPLSNHEEIVYQRLTQRERTRRGFIPCDEQVALAAVLVAETRPVVAFASDPSWPRHPLVHEVAARLRCRIVRRPLAEVPAPVRRHVRVIRYLPDPEAT